MQVSVEKGCFSIGAYHEFPNPSNLTVIPPDRRCEYRGSMSDAMKSKIQLSSFIAGLGEWGLPSKIRHRSGDICSFH